MDGVISTISLFAFIQKLLSTEVTSIEQIIYYNELMNKLEKWSKLMLNISRWLVLIVVFFISSRTESLIKMPILPWLGLITILVVVLLVVADKAFKKSLFSKALILSVLLSVILLMFTLYSYTIPRYSNLDCEVTQIDGMQIERCSPKR